MAETPSTYAANCHCQAIKFSFKLASPLLSVVSCNCTICSRLAYLFTLPLKTDIVFEPGSEEKLKSYEMGSRTSPHRYCGECGSSVMVQFGEGHPRAASNAVNARLIKNVDLSAFTVVPFDGAHLIPTTHNPPVTPCSPPAYSFSCHCGAVRYTAVLPSPAQSIEEHSVYLCKCSICTKNGLVNAYPKRKDVTWESDINKLNRYVWGEKKLEHLWCGTCGCAVAVQLIEGKEDEFPKLKEFFAANLRLANNVDIATLTPIQFDGKSFHKFVYEE